MRKILFCEIWSFWSLFSRAPIRTFSLELFHITYYFYGPWKVSKKGAIMDMLEVILSTKKIKLLNFLVDSVLNSCELTR